MQYLARLEPNEQNGFNVTFPDVPEAITFGHSKEEALAMAQEALSVALKFYIDEGKELPEAKAKRGRGLYAVEPAAYANLKFTLYSVFRASGIKKAELARRMGIPKSNVDRLFNIHRSTNLELLEGAFRALGQRLRIEVEEAA